MPTPPMNITGERYGRLVALSMTTERKRGSTVWEFRCDCGNVTKLPAGPVRAGNVSSCGCLRSEVSREKMKKVRPLGTAATTTHGQSRALGGKSTPTYAAWISMRDRCLNPKHKSYDRYGGRGIKICERWLDSFEAFFEDMGEKPAGTQIDRRENDGDYEPGNCHWVTPQQNANNRSSNRSLTYDGRTQNIKQWAEELDMSHQVIEWRMDNGWSDEDIFNTPVDYGNSWKRGTR